ncbi:hypothetical protein HMPREF3230_00721 [Gardnerella vaginalis]|uniref:Uncharacterized protein n=1 Tax=Gardnerella vaginalis TaxID=2702 RepID=A0A135Z6C2_GARVA|nr:hypothetical protein HMPREF3230_00721 [Gardnerella vaginalis]PNP90036.1 hypothetical protein BFS08_03795 [Gardnerella sp. KA00735]
MTWHSKSVEILPVHSIQIEALIQYIDLRMADSTISWHMDGDGTYTLHSCDEEGRPLVDSQEYLIRAHRCHPRRA